MNRKPIHQTDHAPTHLFVAFCITSVLLLFSSPDAFSQEREQSSKQPAKRQDAEGQQDAKRRSSEQNPGSDPATSDPAIKVASVNDAELAAPSEFATLLETARKKQHPLLPALEYAIEAIEHIEKEVHDYTCLLVKRERINGRLSDYHYIRTKIRHERKEDDRVVAPFSVYLKFLKPARYVNREVLYVQGQHNSDLIAKRGGRRNPNLTLRLDPESPLAMDGNRYPITEIGFYNLAKRLIDVVREELVHNDAQVEVFDNAKINGRPCKRFKVTHPEKKDGLRFHIAEVYVDKELNIPVYYAAYTWPSTAGGKPKLLEQYIYTKVKLNVGLTDQDFDVRNEKYGFRDFDTVPVANQEAPVAKPKQETKAAAKDDDGKQVEKEAKADKDQSTADKDGADQDDTDQGNSNNDQNSGNENEKS